MGVMYFLRYMKIAVYLLLVTPFGTFGVRSTSPYERNNYGLRVPDNTRRGCRVLDGT